MTKRTATWGYPSRTRWREQRKAQSRYKIVKRKEEIVKRGQFQRVDEEPCVKKYVVRQRDP